MEVGTVRSFNDEDGYGFIETADGETYFVHHSNIEMDGFKTLSPGTQVTFEIEIGKRGQEAKQVRKA